MLFKCETENVEVRENGKLKFEGKWIIISKPRFHWFAYNNYYNDRVYRE